MPNNLEKLRTQQRLSMQQMADRVGTDASTISKLEKGKTKLTEQWLTRLAKGLAVDVAAIISEPAPDESDPLRDMPSHLTSRKLIPVMGTAAGSHLQGAIQFSEGTAVNYIDAPPMLENAIGLYGLYVEGESMWPMFKHGSPIIVTPHKPPRIGDAVIIQERTPKNDVIKVTLGVLQSSNSEWVKIGKLNPAATVEFPVRHVHAMHKVLDYSDILGA
jgi:transcriptional regulator with XRE-family HTH domain